MSTLVLIDGVAFAPAEATVSVFDRGFLYGDAVFETLRTYGGRVYELGEHLRRLRRSAERVFIELPLPGEALAREVEDAVRDAGNAESYVRLMVTRGTGELGLAPDAGRGPTRVIIVAPLTPPPRSAYTDGIAAVTYRTQRVTDATPASGAKVSNYLVSVLAMRVAKAAGALEALIVDGAERVLEGASSNVFAWTGGRLLTAGEEHGILAGITRAGVLREAEALGLPVELRPPTLGELLASDEVFVTSSIRELLSVVRVDGQPIGVGRPGPLAQKLHSAFRRSAGVAALDLAPSEGAG